MQAALWRARIKSKLTMLTSSIVMARVPQHPANELFFCRQRFLAVMGTGESECPRLHRLRASYSWAFGHKQSEQSFHSRSPLVYPGKATVSNRPAGAKGRTVGHSMRVLIALSTCDFLVPAPPLMYSRRASDEDVSLCDSRLEPKRVKHLALLPVESTSSSAMR